MQVVNELRVFAPIGWGYSRRVRDRNRLLSLSDARIEDGIRLGLGLLGFLDLLKRNSSQLVEVRRNSRSVPRWS